MTRKMLTVMVIVLIVMVTDHGKRRVTEVLLTDKHNVVRLKWILLGVACLEAYGGEIFFRKETTLKEQYIPVYGFGGWNDLAQNN